MKSIPSFKPIEVALMASFILFIVMPFELPSMVVTTVSNPLGLLALFLTAVYLFFNLHPVVAALFLFAAYELINRVNRQTHKVIMAEHTASQEKKDEKMERMNPVKKTTLEEQMVEEMAPIGHSDPSEYITTSFKPVAEDVGSASLV